MFITEDQVLDLIGRGGVHRHEFSGLT
jgi:hypothetical protein